MASDEQRFAEIKATLYALPPEEFVAARNAAAKQATGWLARAVKGLRRPTLSAWLVNLIAASGTAELSELLTIGDRMREAQQELRGSQIRELSARRQELIASLIGLGRDLAARQGRKIRDDTAWEAETTLRAALSDADLAEQVRAGTVVKPADYNGMGLITGEQSDTSQRGRAKLRVIPGGRSGSAAPEPGVATKRSSRSGTGQRTRAGTAAEHPAGRGRGDRRAPSGAKPARATVGAQELADARRELADAERQLTDADADVDRTTRRLGQITEALEQIRERERQLRAEQTEVDRDRRRAQRRRLAAERAVAQARRRVTSLS